MKSWLLSALVLACSPSALSQTSGGSSGGPNHPSKNYDPADPINWNVLVDVHKTINWQTVTSLGLFQTGSYDSRNPNGSSIPVAVNSNSLYDAFIKNKVAVTVNAVWVGLGAAPTKVRMSKSAYGEATTLGGTMELESGIGIEPSYYLFNGRSSGIFNGSKYFQLPIGGESSVVNWITKSNAFCNGNLSNATATASAGAGLAEVSCRLVSDVETSYFKQAEMQPAPNLLLSWGQNSEDSCATPFTVNGGGAVFEIVVTANHSGASVPHTWELEYDGQGSPGHPPEEPPTPATTIASEISPGKWRLTQVMSTEQYANLIDSPKDFRMKLIGHYDGEEGEFTRTWETIIKIHAKHSNWRQVGEDVYSWDTPSESATTWPTPFTVREGGSGRIRWSWRYPLITVINETLTGNPILNFFDNINLGTQYIGLARKAAILAKSVAVEPQSEEQLNFNDLFEKTSPVEPGAPVSTYEPVLDPQASLEYQRAFYVIKNAHREFKIKIQNWRGDEYGQHGYVGLAPGRTEKYVGRSEAVGLFRVENGSGVPGGNARPQ